MAVAGGGVSNGGAARAGQGRMLTQRSWTVPVQVETLAVPVRVEAARQQSNGLVSASADSRGVESWRSMALPVPRALSSEAITIPSFTSLGTVAQDTNGRSSPMRRSPTACTVHAAAAAPQAYTSQHKDPPKPSLNIAHTAAPHTTIHQQSQPAAPSRSCVSPTPPVPPSNAMHAATPKQQPPMATPPFSMRPPMQQQSQQPLPKQSSQDKAPSAGGVISLTKPPAVLPPALQKDFEIDGDELLGSGSFAVIQRLRHRATRQPAALKVVEKYPLKIREMLPQLKREVKIQGKLKHRHILQLLSCLEDDNYVYMLLEHCPGGSLWELCSTLPSRRLPEGQACVYFTQILSGVDHMHRHGCIHRDLKTENMLLTNNNEEIRICDFGWSAEAQIERALRTTCGTPKFWAPEIFENLPQTAAVDLWALGTLIYELLIGHAPFWGSNEELRRKVLAVDFRYPPGLLSSGAVDLLHCLMVREPHRRIPAGKLLAEHIWVVGKARSSTPTAPGNARMRAGTASPPVVCQAPRAACSRRAQSVDVDRNVVTTAVTARGPTSLRKSARDSWHYV